MRNLKKLNIRAPTELQEQEMQLVSAMYDFDLIKKDLFEEDIWNVQQDFS
jgi:hypothetical protein